MNGGNNNHNDEGGGGEVASTRRAGIPGKVWSDIHAGYTVSGSGSQADLLSSPPCGEGPRKTAKTSPPSSGRPEAVPDAAATDDAIPEMPGPPPKRPLSAYNFFYRDERAKLLADAEEKATGERPHPSSAAAGGTGDGAAELGGGGRGGGRRRRPRPHGVISFGDLCSNMSQRWKQADAETRAKYKEMATGDSKRYRRELDLYHRRQDAYLSALNDMARGEDEAAAAAAAAALADAEGASAKASDGEGNEDTKAQQTPRVAGSDVGSPEGKKRPLPQEEPNVGSPDGKRGSLARHTALHQHQLHDPTFSHCNDGGLRGVRANVGAFGTSLSEIEASRILDARTRLEDVSRESIMQTFGLSQQDVQGAINGGATMEGAGASRYDLAGSDILPPNRMSRLLAPPSLEQRTMPHHPQGRALSELSDYELLEMYRTRRDGGRFDQVNALQSHEPQVDWYRHLNDIGGGIIPPFVSHGGLTESATAQGLGGIAAYAGFRHPELGGYHENDRPFGAGSRPQENALDATHDGVAHMRLLMGLPPAAHSLGASHVGRVDPLKLLSSTDFSRAPFFDGGDPGRDFAPLPSSMTSTVHGGTLTSTTARDNRDALNVQDASNIAFGIGGASERALPHARSTSDTFSLR